MLKIVLLNLRVFFSKLIRVVFLFFVFFFKIKPPLKSSLNEKMLPMFKKKAIYYSNQLLNLETMFWEALKFEAMMLQLCTFHMDLHP